MISDSAGQKFESERDIKSTPMGMAQRWATEIEASKKFLRKFHDAGDRIVKRYLDERADESMGEGASKVNLFWSTVQVLLAQLYTKPPKADVSRTYFDADDDQARVASSILQRILNKGGEDALEQENSFKLAIEDFLIVGLGQVWVRYELETEQVEVEGVPDPVTGELIPQLVEQVANEDACVDYVHWKDFFYSPARTWNEVRWVARRVYMTKDALTTRFGEKIAAEVPLIQRKGRQGQSGPVAFDPWDKAEVYEIWCKEHKAVYWYSPGCSVILDYKPDTLELADFFPCPRPLVSNVTTTKLVPRAMYVMAQDQFEELDEINTRITWLTRAAKVVGVYDKNAEGVNRMLSQGAENQLIPVDNWAMFAEGGGIKGRVDFMPIDQVVNAIEKLRVYRQDKVQQIYEVLGISDIMRGNTRASETASAQQIKAQFGSARLQLQQVYVSDWASSAMRKRAEIICDLWQPQSIVEASNIERTADAQYVPQAIELLKNEGARAYRITIDTDAMATIDYAQERDSAVQFLQGLGAFVSQVTPMVERSPEAGPFLLKMLQWGVSKFRISREIESTLDQAIAAMNASAQAPKSPPPPDPAIVKAQMDTQVKMAEIQSREKIAILESNTDKEVAALKGTIEMQKIEQQARMDQIAAQMQAFQEMLSLQTATMKAPSIQLDGLAQQLSAMDDSNRELNMGNQQAMQALLGQMSKKRRRVPIRDPRTGDILEVREIEDETEPQPMPGMGLQTGLQ
jgi:hypothetical protein